MDHWKNFKSFKQRGEWVELRFMATAAERGFYLLKPWGDVRPYDVGIEHGPNFLRVQVKCSAARKGRRGGYICRLRQGKSERRYNPADVDLFAIYILPVEAWYLIPSAVVLLPSAKMHLSFYPDGPPRRGRHTANHDYERYREAWHLLAKTHSSRSAIPDLKARL